MKFSYSLFCRSLEDQEASISQNNGKFNLHCFGPFSFHRSWLDIPLIKILASIDKTNPPAKFQISVI